MNEMFEEMNDLLAADADYVVWVAKIEAEQEDAAFMAWVDAQAEMESNRIWV